MRYADFERLLAMMTDDGPDPHAHKCPACRHIWGHDRANIHTEEENDNAHTCQKCAMLSDGCYDRYHGPRHSTDERGAAL